MFAVFYADREDPEAGWDFWAFATTPEELKRDQDYLNSIDAQFLAVDVDFPAIRKPEINGEPVS